MMRVINAYPTLVRFPIAVLVDDLPVDDAAEAPVAGVNPIGKGIVIVAVEPSSVTDAEPEPKSTLAVVPLADVLGSAAVILRVTEDTLVPLQKVL